MAEIQGAVVKEQGVTFAIAIVKKSVLDSPSRRTDATRAFKPLFGGLPLVLMAQDGRGVPTYLGRRDLVDFFANVPVEAIPWRKYSVT